MNSGKIVLALLTGVAAGALLGILFAPAKGSETRKKISGKGGDLAESMKEKFNEFLDDISDKYEDIKEEAADNSERSTVFSKKTGEKAKTASV